MPVESAWCILGLERPDSAPVKAASEFTLKEHAAFLRGMVLAALETIKDRGL